MFFVEKAVFRQYLLEGSTNILFNLLDNVFIWNLLIIV